VATARTAGVPGRRVLVIAGIAAAALVGAYLFLVLKSGDVAAGGTTVQGVLIGGMSQADAQAAVDKELGALAAKRIRVKAGADAFPVRPADAGIVLDSASSVAPAYGHIWNPVALISHLWSGHELPAVLTVDTARLNAEVEAIAATVDQPAVEPAIDVKHGEAVVTPGKDGLTVDIPATSAAIEAAVLRPRAPVQAVLVKATPTTSDEEVQAAVAEIQSATASPVTVTAGGVTAEIPAATVRKALTFEPDGGAMKPVLDGAVLHASIAGELAPVETQGRDATFKIKNGKVKVVKSKVGTGVSDEALATAVAGVLDLPPDQRHVVVELGTREPKLTTEEAQALGVTERVSSFTQNFPYAAYRVQNIGQAAKRINGTILKPGETFSMNDTIGERTKENGYTEGFVVGEGGVFQEALGGGVSTSATTTWTAAFYAGMERVQTVAHSIYISRYQPGLEATVAWGMFDMKFRNPGPSAVFITAGITNTSMTVSFWGTKNYDDIKADFHEKRDMVPFEKIYDDSDTCLGQAGVDGFTITVDRVFYQDGKEVKREPITTKYKPAPDVTCGKDPKKKDPKKDGKKDGKNQDQPADGTTTDATDPAKPSGSDANGTDTFSN
jgi:vancomycin resistance protein YoaR